jgi:aryl-alcohol dehydrogenase-like predicted oxidoreductase
MEYTKFGNTDLKTSKIVYGCMGVAGAFGSQEESDSIDAMRTAYDMGINFFDTAEVYGDGYSEELLSKALGDKRSDIVITDKVCEKHMKRDEIIKSCEASLRRLNTDYIDMYLLHWPVYDVPMEERIEALELLKKQGKIRYYGVSNFGSENLDEIMSHTDIAADEVVYNLLYRCIEDEVLPKCRKHNVPILTYSSLMQGLLAGKYKNLSDFPANRARTRMFDNETHPQARHKERGCEREGKEALEKIWEIVYKSDYTMEELSVGWLKAQEGVGGVLVGTRNAEQSRDLKKLIDINLEKEWVDSLTEATSALKRALGSNIDMWDHRTK